MAALGKILARYEPRFEQRGFRRANAADRGPLYVGAGNRLISYDRIMGGNLRCFLSISPAFGRIPNPNPEIEAETRWWETEFESTLESAVAQSWQYLEECGFSFLDDPLRLTPTEWRERYNLLVRDSRMRSLVVTWPNDWNLNDVIIRAKRCVKSFAAISALELRQQLLNQTSLIFRDTPLANALETKQIIEAQGFSVKIREQ